MIQTVRYGVRDDGAVLYRTYSDQDKMIRKDGTDELYCEAIDLENSGAAYTETEIPIDEGTEPTLSDVLLMLNELGVNTDDNEA